mmetsp:Transcript_24101/g.43082  ORF Transcript_24101/g.43082 Transcript_24101/m.43082 type:complete len:162 (+) Transcript_24101:811-1296(+)
MVGLEVVCGSGAGGDAGGGEEGRVGNGGRGDDGRFEKSGKDDGGESGGLGDETDGAGSDKRRKPNADVSLAFSPSFAIVATISISEALLVSSVLASGTRAAIGNSVSTTGASTTGASTAAAVGKVLKKSGYGGASVTADARVLEGAATASGKERKGLPTKL